MPPMAVSTESITAELVGLAARACEALAPLFLTPIF